MNTGLVFECEACNWQKVAENQQLKKNSQKLKIGVVKGDFSKINLNLNQKRGLTFEKNL